MYLLQVLRHVEYQIKSESNFVQARRVAHDRGAILDRAGRVLVDNRPAHDVYVTKAFLPDSWRSLAQLNRVLGLSKDRLSTLDKAILSAQAKLSNAPITLAQKLDQSQVETLETLIAEHHLLGLRVFEQGSQGATLSALPKQFLSTRLVLQRLAKDLNLSDKDLKAIQVKLDRAHGLDKFLPIKMARDISWNAYVKLATSSSLFELPGVDLRHSQRRRYRFGSMAAHVLGYTNEVGKQELKRLKEDGYHMGDAVGRSGLEWSFERELRGIDGAEKVVVDAKGRRMDEQREAALLGDNRDEPAQPGHSLVLSLDAEVQQVAEQSFADVGGRAGAVVAVEAKTGFIIAMASIPAYDPNVVSGNISRAEKRRLDNDRLQPWFNKAIQQQYPPGSTFKVTTALAGLRSGVITPQRRINCPGYFKLGRAMWRCWLLSGHGAVDLHSAIQKSCDTYFYTVGFEAGIDALAQAGQLLGFGRRTGIQLRHESPGLVADRAYYQRRPDGYQKGYVVNNAIGQGDIAVTPLQLALAYAAVGNGGKLYTPQLVREIRDHQGRVLHRFGPKLRWKIPVDPKILTAIQDGLAAVLEPGGTAHGLFWRRKPEGMSKWVRQSGVHLAGKTGTAQVIKMGKNIKKMHELDYWERDHAWFVAYAPAEDPEIAVAVVNEHSGHGGSSSAPVAANVIRAYFEKVRPREIAPATTPKANLAPKQDTTASPKSAPAPSSDPPQEPR